MKEEKESHPILKRLSRMSLELIGFERRIKDRLIHLTRNGGGVINIECCNSDVIKKIKKYEDKRWSKDAGQASDEESPNSS